MRYLFRLWIVALGYFFWNDRLGVILVKIVFIDLSRMLEICFFSYLAVSVSGEWRLNAIVVFSDLPWSYRSRLKKFKYAHH
ncbi:MAG: hypothetical protein ACJA04_001059 [Cellvibrionaceae bacterium]|jgi:hypothetical protein